MPQPSRSRTIAAFTLLELLLTITLAAVLAALLGSAISGASAQATQTACAGTLKNIGAAIQIYIHEHEGEFPRSYHSAGAHRQPGWAASVAPYLATGENLELQDWTPVFNRLFRCRADKNRDPYIYSYALNVHFELDPDGDDYTGAPSTWRRIVSVPKPAATILMGESRPVYFGDHFMCHQWSGLQGARNAVDYKRHGNKSNYLFADGHTEHLAIEATFDPARGINLWNPSLAR